MAPSRRPFIGGNWKCNGTTESIEKLAVSLNKASFNPNNIDVVIFPAAIHHTITQNAFKPHIAVGSQNCSMYGDGAYTGEMSIAMLKDMKVPMTLIGHSERRQFFGDSDEVIAKKVEIAQKEGFMVVLCIGELLSERNAGKTEEVCKRQMEAVIPMIKDWSKIVIAYEPVWAIGTGVVATPEEAQEAHEAIRSLLKEKVSESVSQEVRIIYGGSVNENNCTKLIGQKDIDGFLVGGASLKPSFADIIACAAQ